MTVIIWVTGALAALSALGVVFSRQPLYSALSLVMTIGALSVDQSDLGLVNTAGNVQTVGGQLFTTFLLPFEITSLLLLVAAVGAVYLTRRTRSGDPPERRERALGRKPEPTLEEDRIEVEVG